MEGKLKAFVSDGLQTSSNTGSEVMVIIQSLLQKPFFIDKYSSQELNTSVKSLSQQQCRNNVSQYSINLRSVTTTYLQAVHLSFTYQ